MQLRRGLPVEAKDLARLDAAALEKVRAEVAPGPRSPDELHDLLLSTLVHRPGRSGRSGSGNSSAVAEPWRCWWQTSRRRRAGTGSRPRCGAPRSGGPGSRRCTAGTVPAGLPPGAGPGRRPTAGRIPGLDADVAAAPGGPGPPRAHRAGYGEGLWRQRCALAPSRVLVGLARLEAEGFAMQGAVRPRAGREEQWCARHLLARIHGYTQNRLASGGRTRQPSGLHAVPVALAARGPGHPPPGTGRPPVGHRAVAGIRAGRRSLGGGGLSRPGRGLPAALAGGPVPVRRSRAGAGCRCERPTPTANRRRGASTPSRATPVTFTLRSDLPWLTLAHSGGALPEEPAHGAARDVLDALQRPWRHVLLRPARSHRAARRRGPGGTVGPGGPGHRYR